MKRISPLAALAYGAAAGAVGSLAQDLFFAATSKWSPKTRNEGFTEGAPRDETATQKVARRFVEGVARRPIANKELGGKLVHYGYGAAWGGIYGIAAASARAVDSPLGALGFGTSVWMLSDNLLLPALKLGGWPREYPVKTHAYAFAVHVVYGLAVWGTFEALRRRAWTPVAATLGAGWMTRSAPGFARGPLRKGLARAWRAKQAVEALGV